MMSEENVAVEDVNETVAPIVQNELEVLKKRATQMGLKFHHRIGVEKLRAQVDAAINGQSLDEDTREQQIKELQEKMQANLSDPSEAQPETKAQRAKRLRKEASELVRIRVSCMNPNKKEYEGEIFTVSNSVVGTFKKYVPYNTESGWHVPHIIYEHLKEKQCQVFYTTKGPRGEKIRKGKLQKEFAIEVLDSLTGEQVKELARKQAMANNIG